jgi:hypothetical protein
MLGVGPRCSGRHLLLGSPPLASGDAPGLAGSLQWSGAARTIRAFLLWPCVETGPARSAGRRGRQRCRSVTVAVFVAPGKPPVLVEQGTPRGASLLVLLDPPRRPRKPPPKKILQPHVITRHFPVPQDGQRSRLLRSTRLPPDCHPPPDKDAPEQGRTCRHPSSISWSAEEGRRSHGVTRPRSRHQRRRPWRTSCDATRTKQPSGIPSA